MGKKKHTRGIGGMLGQGAIGLTEMKEVLWQPVMRGNKRMRIKILEKQIRRGNINPQPNISYLKIGSLNVYGINEASRYGVET